MERGQSSCTGAIMSKPNLTMFGGQYRILQSISECILQHGLWGMRSTVYDGFDEGLRLRTDYLLESSCSAMISSIMWNNAEGSPYFAIGVGPYDLQQAGYCG